MTFEETTSRTHIFEFGLNNQSQSLAKYIVQYCYTKPRYIQKKKKKKKETDNFLLSDAFCQPRPQRLALLELLESQHLAVYMCYMRFVGRDENFGIRVYFLHKTES